ncbi:MAG TPA: TonB-dependent receptor [Bacteroidetes bacterium]|nr:TonB-dependent receptor [Bacteroidota bacterium]
MKNIFTKKDKQRAIRYECCLVLSLLFALPVYAQQIKINGSVKDTEGIPLIGVNVLIKNTKEGTITDLNGKYELTALPTDTLQFSYTGYATEERPVNGQAAIEVVMAVASRLLDEVVVVGYGVQRKSDLTGAVSSVRAKELTKIPTPSVGQALQGKIAGVQVMAASGRPGQGAVIRVRGTGTLNNADPVFVVDGMITNDIDFLNTNEIESIEVLKDASATAIYGSRGANGVILITTRQGKTGQDTRFSFSSYLGVQSLARKIELANARQYATLYNEAGKFPSFDDPALLGNGTDWQDVIFRNADIQNHHLAVQGGTDKMHFYVSADLLRQQGIIRTSGFERYSLRINNGYSLTRWLTLGHNLSVVQRQGNNEPGGIVFNAYAADPTIEAIDANGHFGSTSLRSNVSNPAAQLEYQNFNRYKSTRLVGSLFATARFFSDFVFKTSIGIDAAFGKQRHFEPEFKVDDKQFRDESFLFVQLDRSYNWLWENTLSLHKEWNRHRLSLLGGITSQANFFEFLQGSRKRIIENAEALYFLGAGDSETQENNHGGDQWKYLSYLFRTNYVFNDKYLLTASFRADGSSRFGANNRRGYFPSFALGWRIIEEAFMKNQNLFTNFKLRASWGIIGNDKIGSYEGRPVVQTELNAVFGNNEQSHFGATPIDLANPDIHWEEARQADIGLELGFFKNKLTLEADYFHRTTSEVLVNVPLPLYAGAQNDPRLNAAKVLNRGIELNLGWQDEPPGGFGYHLNLLATSLHNEVLELADGKEDLRGGGIPGGFVTNTQPGLPIGAFYGYKVLGVFQNEDEINASPHSEGDNREQPGDLRFADVNGDGGISTDDRTFIGSPIPNLLFSFNFGLQYKSIDLSLDFHGQSGNKIANVKKMMRFFGTPNYEASFLNRWTGEGTSHSEPRINNDGYPNFTMSERFLENGSFFRLRSLQLGFRLPAAILNKINFNSLYFYVSGTNVKTWTDYSGYTPEITSENVLENGIDRGIYPVAKIWTMGARAEF